MLWRNSMHKGQVKMFFRECWCYAMLAVTLLCAVMLSGCSPKPPAVSLSTAIGSIQTEMVKTKALPISGFDTWTAGKKSAFESEIHDVQCQQWRDDPIVPVTSGPTAVSLQGSFTKEGAFQVGNVLSTPSVSLSGSASRTSGQTVSSAVSFVSLSAIPSTEQEMEVDRAGALLSQNDDYRHAVAARIIKERDAFHDYIASLISTWTPLSCGANTYNPHPFFTGAKYPNKT